MKDWILILEPADRVEAEAAFSRWKQEHVPAGDVLLPEDVRIDIICGDAGQRYRYWVRRDRMHKTIKYERSDDG